MKCTYLLLVFVVAFYSSNAQITITASDMPVVNDTLRYSMANPVGFSINLGDSGTNKTWHYDSLKAILQAVDTYKTAKSVNASYALTISSSAYGYKIGDSIPGLSASGLPVTVSDIYTFFNIKSSPSRYIAEAFAANVNSLPIPANYTNPDVWYYFPLTYPHASDSTNYSLTVSLPGLGSLKQKGYRVTRVDSWGSITTPYYTTAVNCIRVRSEVHEIDSLNIALLGTSVAIPRNNVEYKWLANGEHYPALWVTTNLTTGKLSSISYKDIARHGLLSVTNTNTVLQVIKAYPNPAINGMVHLDIPVGWNNFEVVLFDIRSKQVAVFHNEHDLNIQSLSHGTYIAYISCGQQAAFVQIIK